MWPESYAPYAILADPTSHPVHKMYAEINIGIRERGESWGKCANCGQPYMHSAEWSDSTLCSADCRNSYLDYLNNEGMGYS